MADGRKGLIYGAVLLGFVLLLDFLAAASLVLWRYARGHDYVTAAESMHLTRWTLFPFINPNLAELPDGVRYVGNLGLPAYNLGHAHGWFVSDPIYGWRLGAGVAASKTWWPRSGIRLTNRQGFASDGRAEFNYSRPKPADVFRIVVLGGSTVEGDGVAHYTMNLPAQLRLELERTYGGSRRIEVVNAGVGGYHSAQEAAYFLDELLAYEPDAAVFYHGWNDQQRAAGAMSRMARGLSGFRTEAHDRMQARSDASYTLAGSALMMLQTAGNRALGLVSGSGLFTVAATAVGKLARAAQAEEAASAAAQAQADVDDLKAVYHAYMARRYAAMVEHVALAARRGGVAVAFLLQPLLGVDGKILTEAERRLAEAIPDDIRRRVAFYEAARAAYGHLARTHGPSSAICFRDLSAVAFDGLADPVYEDSGHLDAHGNAIAARAIVQALAECGTLHGLAGAAAGRG